MFCEDSVGKGCLAIPQEVGGLPEMVVSQNTAGLIRSGAAVGMVAPKVLAARCLRTRNGP